MLPAEAARAYLAAMEDWIAGRRSTWNTHAQVEPERRNEALASCAREDAARVAMHADAARAYAALIGSGVEVETVGPWS